MKPKSNIIRSKERSVPGLLSSSLRQRASTPVSNIGKEYGETVWDKHGRLIGGIIGAVASMIIFSVATYCIRKDKKQKMEVRERAAQVNSEYGLPFTGRMMERA